MIPIQQTKFGKRFGNCFEACIASIFEISLYEAPDLSIYGSLWWVYFTDWCHERGLHPVDLLIGTDTFSWVGDGYYIVSGPSPRIKYLHAVVYKDGQMVHDPHPSGDGILEATHITLFTKYFE